MTEVQELLEMGASLLDKAPIWAQVVQMTAEIVGEESCQGINAH